MDGKLRVTVVGLGVMGGSFLKALRPLGLQALYGVDVDKDVMDMVWASELIDDGDVSPERFLPKTDLLILCLPPKVEVDFMKRWQGLLPSGAVVTDVCGVKVPMLQALLPYLREDIGFIPGHPMCGREVGGFKRSHHELYLGCNYILTPLKGRDAGMEMVKELAHAVGTRKMVITTPEEHDGKIALSSHLPHVVASALMLCTEAEDVGGFTGGSFKDATRVAAMNVPMWSDLMEDNREALLTELHRFNHHMQAFTKALEDGDKAQMEAMLERSTQLKERDL